MPSDATAQLIHAITKPDQSLICSSKSGRGFRRHRSPVKSLFPAMGNGCRGRHDRRQQIQRDPDARIPPSKGTRCPSSQSASRLFDPSTGDRDRFDVDGLASQGPFGRARGLCICGLGLKCAQSRLSPGATWLEIDSMGFSPLPQLPGAKP